MLRPSCSTAYSTTQIANRHIGNRGLADDMSALGVFLSAAGAVLVLLLIVEGIAHWAGGAFITTVVLGEDGRTSTSKTFVFLWTLLVGWALVSLLIAGELLAAHSCTAGKTAEAIKACTAKHDDVGLLQLGWMHFLKVGLVGSYAVLLGIPAVAAVAAKGITQGKVSKGALIKPNFQPKQGSRGIGPRVAQIFSSDDGATDIGDFQYMIFNLILAVYFVSNFVKPTATGLPTIPDTLLGLTSVSAALYVGKKAASNKSIREEPRITNVFPGVLRPGGKFSVIGNGLADPAVPQPTPPPAVEIMINGLPATNVTVDPTVANRLNADAPVNLVPAAVPAGQTIDGTLQVSTRYGAITPGFAVQCVR
jgi:hypothetical protein